MRNKMELVRIDHAVEVGREAEADFVCALERGLLLSLKESGCISELQFRKVLSRLPDQKGTVCFGRSTG